MKKKAKQICVQLKNQHCRELVGCLIHVMLLLWVNSVASYPYNTSFLLLTTTKKKNTEFYFQSVCIEFILCKKHKQVT